MVMEQHKAFYCKKCGEVFFQRRDPIQNVRTNMMKILGLLTCPKCGSKEIHENTAVRT